MLLGPDGNGAFAPVQVKSVHSKRVPVKTVYAGMSAGFALKKIKRSTIRKGMVMVPMGSNPQPTIYFEADVVILYHSTTIHTNYQPVIQCLTMRQSAKIVHISDREVLRTGDRSRVMFKFMYRPEFMKEGMRVIFREGRCKGIGIITRVAIPPEEAEATIAKAKAEEAAKAANGEESGDNKATSAVENKPASAAK
jgi:GTPase